MAKKPSKKSRAYWWREAYSEAHARVAELEAENDSLEAENAQLRGAAGRDRTGTDFPDDWGPSAGTAYTSDDGPRMWDGERWQPIGGALRNLAAAPDRNPPGAFDPPALPPMPDETPDAELEGEDGEAPIGWQASLDRIWDALNASEADLRERADKLTIEMGEGFARLEARIEALERGGTDWGHIIMARIAVLDGQAFHDLPARLVALEKAQAMNRLQGTRRQLAEQMASSVTDAPGAGLHVQQFAGQPRCNCADCVAHDAAEATR